MNDHWGMHVHGRNEMAILKEIVDGRIYLPPYFNENVPELVEKI